MNTNQLMGTQKFGCLIDNDKRTLTHYISLSLSEKIIGKNKILTLNYSDIQYIKICYGLTTWVRFDSAQIILEVHTSFNIYDILMTYFNTTKNDLKSFQTVDKVVFIFNK